VGSGDPLGMQGTHTQAAGMGGMRAAGDLVARMQMTRGMRLQEAKEHVAAKLGVSTFDLSDPAVMTDVRNEHGFGRIHSYAISHPGQANFIEAKFNISRVLDVPINCVERFKERAGLAPVTTVV
jgi:dimethylamine--corrinoid protein Co-methyltransferase